MKLFTASRMKKTKKILSTGAIAFAMVTQSVLGVGVIGMQKASAIGTTVQPCATTSSTYISSLTGWNTSETRATGHNEITASGLHVWTDSATSTDKAAAYYPVNYALAAGGIPEWTLTNTSGGGVPGKQLVVDFNNDGTADGILVGETVYGNDWWLSNSATQFVKDGAPSHTGGSGSENHGTLDGWVTAFPNAQVKAIGYSLGSGVKGDVTFTSMTFGCVNYTFGLPDVRPSTTINVPVGVVGNNFTVSGDAHDDRNLNRVYVQLVNRQTSQRYGGTTIHLIGQGTDAHWSNTFDARSLGMPDGEYAAHATVVDMVGNTGSAGWTENFTVDTTAPAVPTNVVMTGPNGGVLAKDWYINSYSVVTKWDAVEGAVKYQYAYWNNIPGSDFNAFEKAWMPETTSLSLGGVFNQGSGTHFVAVRAIDAAGNASAWSEPYSVIYDGTMPTFTIESINNQPATGQIVVNPITTTTDETITLVGSFSDNMWANYLQLQIVKDGLDKGISFAFGQHASGSTLATFDATGFVDGNYQLYATGTDIAGNVTSAVVYSFSILNPVINVDDTTQTPGDKTGTPTGTEGPEPTGSETTGYVAGATTTAPTAAIVTLSGGLGSLARANTNVVLAEETVPTEDDTEPQVLGAKDVAQTKTDTDTDTLMTENTSSTGCYKILGICWYWWLLTIPVVGVIYWLYRKSRDND